MDCDGDLDMVMAQGSGEPSTVWRNSLSAGTLGFEELFYLPISSDQTASVQLADIDRDGHMDILFGHRDGAAIHYGTGVLQDGGFTLTHVFAQGGLGFAELRDVNADGYPDVWLGANFAVGVQLYLGGALGFASAPDQSLPAGAVRCLSLGDRDGDGDLDLITGELQLDSPNGRYINR